MKETADEIRLKVEEDNDRREWRERWTPILPEFEMPKPAPQPERPDPWEQTYFVNYYPEGKRLMSTLWLDRLSAKFASGEDAQQIEVRLVRVTT